MKTEFVDVSETRKRLVVEIPSTVVDAEIDRVTRTYSRAARIPGFRPGKVPVKLVKQRFRQQILHDVAHDLIPRAVDDALRERGVEPVDTPDIADVVVDEGQPLKFTASFETVPPIDPGDYASISLRRQPAVLEADAVESTLKQLQNRMARYEPVEDRAIETGDTVTVDLNRRAQSSDENDRHQDVSVELGAPANPPGFDAELLGLSPGAEKQFTIQYPEDYTIKDLAGTSVAYDVAVKAIRRRVVPDLDDELAKDVGVDSLDALRERVRQDLLREAEQNADRQLRVDLLQELSSRVTIEVPQTLLDREIDRRTEEFARRLVEQRIDPQKTNIDWDQFRESQRATAQEAVKSALVLDEVARREGLVVTDEDIERELGGYAERAGRSIAAVRATLEKEGGLGRLQAGLRREKAVDFLLSRARIDRE
jgi:trigger factor